MRPLMKIMNRDDEREQELRERATTLMNGIEAKVEKSFFIRTYGELQNEVGVKEEFDGSWVRTRACARCGRSS